MYKTILIKYINNMRLSTNFWRGPDDPKGWTPTNYTILIYISPPPPPPTLSSLQFLVQNTRSRGLNTLRVVRASKEMAHCRNSRCAAFHRRTVAMWRWLFAGESNCRASKAMRERVSRKRRAQECVASRWDGYIRVTRRRGLIGHAYPSPGHYTYSRHAATFEYTRISRATTRIVTARAKSNDSRPATEQFRSKFDEPATFAIKLSVRRPIFRHSRELA